MKSWTTLSLSILFGGVLVFVAGGCGVSYKTPSRGADFEKLAGMPASAEAGDKLRQSPADQTDGGIQRYPDKRPQAKFPTAIAVARVQAPGYRSQTAIGYGTGSYCVVTTRDIERDEHFERLSKLPQLSGVAPVNRLLLPQNLQSDYELRQAAARLRADVLLIYTIDTAFFDQDRTTPLSVVTLGIGPTQRARVITTASALLMDTRNGYIYGLAEATEQQEQLRNAWATQDDVDRTRREVESKAFDELVGELEKTWRGVIQENAVQASVLR